MKRPITLSLTAFLSALVFLTVPDPAQAFRHSYALTVVQVPDSRAFEVLQERAAGPQQVWCAAAEHARHVLRLPTSTRLYIERGRGPSPLAQGRTTIRFSPDPVEPVGPKQDGPYTLSLRDVGFSRSIGQAASFCDGRIEDLFDRF